MPNDSAQPFEEATRSYYETDDVDAFYDAVWGGEDIHIGIYDHEHEAIADASRRTVERAAAEVADLLTPGSTVLDLGSGYGGSSRHLAEHFGCRVVALNISEAQNRRHRAANVERGLDGLIEVVTGSFQDIPYGDGHFDVVWSLEAFCHSGDRTRLIGEAVRVLKPQGALVFTDLMAADDSLEEALRSTVSRLGVDALATPEFYLRALAELGVSRADFDDRSGHLTQHYVRLTEETERRQEELRGVISPAYVDNLLANLPLWADAARRKQLRWGIFHGRRA
ncbi:methyltransferase domain-containing protein [Streptomyces sp. NPDC041068]|uniref:SAM-dependent methyltransferase n=1 Tax=Streptomyces sp. NPDC041068 TaxID=3155130 RepID=UPI0034106C75